VGPICEKGGRGLAWTDVLEEHPLVWGRATISAKKHAGQRFAAKLREAATRRSMGSCRETGKRWRSGGDEGESGLKRGDGKCCACVYVGGGKPVGAVVLVETRLAGV